MNKENDIKWSELNKQLLEAIQNKDWNIVSGCYGEMAYIVAREGKAANHLIKERNKYELLRLKEIDIKEVEILTAKNVTCDYCAPLEGKILTIEEALKTMPIPGDCSNDLFETGHSFCRCLYLPVMK
jgi:hypothetical protein